MEMRSVDIIFDRSIYSRFITESFEQHPISFFAMVVESPQRVLFPIKKHRELFVRCIHPPPPKCESLDRHCTQTIRNVGRRDFEIFI